MQISNLNSKKEQKSKARMYILIALVVAVVLLLVLLVLLVMFSSATPKKLTLSIDGKETQFAQGTFIIENETVYVSLKDIASLVGYRYNDGVYKQYTEDKTKCYLENDNEVVTYSLDEDSMYKTLNNGNIQYNEFKMPEPVKSKNSKLYINSTGLSIGCNLSFSYNKSTNKITINTLQNLYNTYSQKASKGEYTGVDSLDDSFENQKAILRGMIVVKSTIKGEVKYGVVSLDGKNTYLGIKYDEMKFIENSQEFLVRGDKKYGIMTKNGTQRVALEYDKIELLDSINNLYYAVKDGKKCVLDKDGNILSGSLYDDIGVNTSLFPKDSIGNGMLLYGNCIPVKLGDKWGFIDVKGNIIASPRFESLGYIESATKTNNNILLIEDKSGIVVSRNGNYGIIDMDGNGITPFVFDKIYSEKIGDKSVYYLEFDGEYQELNDYVKKLERNHNSED